MPGGASGPWKRPSTFLKTETRRYVHCAYCPSNLWCPNMVAYRDSEVQIGDLSKNYGAQYS